MSPRTLTELTIREVPLLRDDEPVGAAVRRIVEADVPALPVVDERGALKGIFGEREFIAAIFPGYLGELSYAGFVDQRIEETLEKRRASMGEAVAGHMNTDHIDVGHDFSDAQVAEVFLHHRVLIVPVLREQRVAGIVTRNDFFKALVERAGA